MNIPKRQMALAVGSTAFSVLGLELVLSRIFPFFLGNISAFWAIPIAMMGLGLGSLVQHFDSKDFGPSALPVLSGVLLLSTAAAVVLSFHMFNNVFEFIHHKLQNPRQSAWKTICIAGTFLVPFAVGGLTLGACFRAAAHRIGRLYGVDLLASALACAAVPVVLHWLDMPVVIAGLLGVEGIAWVALMPRKRWLVAAMVLLAWLPTTWAASQQKVFTAHPDPDALGVRYAKGQSVEEIRHLWNEISRVALVKFYWPGGNDPSGRKSETVYKLIHDDGISNVKLKPYVPVRVRMGKRSSGLHGIPFLLDKPPDSALVIFAGAGRDMVLLYESASGKLDVTGVEINGLVPRLVSEGGYDEWNLKAFYDLPDVHLEVDEARSFLDRDDRRYPLIFVGSNGAQHTARTGHSRRFLDTIEALEAYLDHLTEDGLLIFAVQPQHNRVEMFRRLFKTREIKGLKNRFVMLKSRQYSLLVKPSGFSEKEVARIRAHWTREKGNSVKYAPGDTKEERERWLKVDPGVFVPIDDRPFWEPIDLEGFELFPKKSRLKRIKYALSWVKVFTFLFFGACTVLAIGLGQVRQRGGRRMPLGLTAYFLVTGICYMVTQIGLMAKLELFMGLPIYAISAVLASYLLANAGGAALVHRLNRAGRRPPIWLVAGIAAVCLLATLGAVEIYVTRLLWLPMWAKTPLAVLGCAPLALVLGAFYPLGVLELVDRDQDQLVPFSFALAALSSMLGGIWAAAAVINLGFSAVVLQAEIGYAGLALVSGGAVLYLRRASASHSG